MTSVTFNYCRRGPYGVIHNGQFCALGNSFCTLGPVPSNMQLVVREVPASGLAAADPIGLRERKKDATRRALAEHALALAVQRGFAGFTIADLVAEVGVSRRTFSNYFASKAECIAAVTDGWLGDVLDAIRQAPPDASLLDVLRTGLMAVAEQGDERWGALQAVAETEPELQARLLAGDEDFAEIASSEIASRVGLPRDDIRVRLLAAFAVTAGREVLTRWVTGESRGDNSALASLLTDAFSILNPDALELRPDC